MGCVFLRVWSKRTEKETFKYRSKLQAKWHTNRELTMLRVTVPLRALQKHKDLKALFLVKNPEQMGITITEEMVFQLTYIPYGDFKL